MFAYALIAAELLLLSLVFWFVFIREPKPFEVKENMWGYYQTPEEQNASLLPPFATSYNDEFSFPSKSKATSKRRRINHQFKRMVRRTRHGVRNGISRGEDELRNGWIYVEEAKTNYVANFLACVGQMLTNLSAKFS